MTVRTLSEAMIDQMLADSFPASDPPAWTLGLDIQSGLNVAVASPNEAQNNEPDSTTTGVNTHDHQGLICLAERRAEIAAALAVNTHDHQVLIRFLVPAFLLTLNSH
jgi:hypothetical protein